jgi:hypothetical protein
MERYPIKNRGILKIKYKIPAISKGICKCVIFKNRVRIICAIPMTPELYSPIGSIKILTAIA